MDASTQSMPRDLAAIPEGERIVEAFGWAPSSWAGGLVLLTGLPMSQSATWGLTEIILVVAALLLALFLVVHEVRRRKRPKVLVRPGYGPLIGIYRDGQLQRTVALAQSHLYLRRPSRTWGPLFMLCLTTLASLAFLLPSPFPLSIGDRLLALLAAAFSASLAASMVKTRLRCEDCLFPYPDTPGFEHVLVPKQAVKRIFSRAG